MCTHSSDTIRDAYEETEAHSPLLWCTIFCSVDSTFALFSELSFGVQIGVKAAWWRWRDEVFNAVVTRGVTVKTSKGESDAVWLFQLL